MQRFLDRGRGSIASGSGRAIFDAVMRAARRNEPPAPPPIARVRRPSIERFAEIRRAAVPVVMEGITDDWPARTTWSLAGLRARFGDRRVSVIDTDGGRLVADASKGVAFRAMRFDDYIDQIEQGRPGAYLAAPGTWLPELRDDVREPPYCRDAPVRISRFWLSAPGTSCPLHRDMAENIFCQIVGRKRFYLYPPAAAPWLYSHGFRSALPNYSRFDPEKADYDRFPLSREVAPIEVVLGPGDAMYLPTRWWHQVRSLDTSMSYNFWWADGLLSFVVRAAELVKSARGLEIYGLEAAERRGGYDGGRPPMPPGRAGAVRARPGEHR